MDQVTRARHDALRKETMISAVMNVLLGLFFFWIVFGWSRAETASVALDFLPQTMGMTFLGGMVSSLICLSRVAKGTLVAAGPVPTRRGQVARVFGCAVAATMVFGGAVALLVMRLAPAELEPATSLIMKSIYGIFMAFVTTPPILRMALGMSFWPHARRSTLSGVPS